jgi:hypothetical protein
MTETGDHSQCQGIIISSLIQRGQSSVWDNIGEEDKAVQADREELLLLLLLVLVPRRLHL